MIDRALKIVGAVVIAAALLVGVVVLFAWGTAYAQDAATGEIRCEAGMCLVPESTLRDIAATLAAMRGQLESYAKMCNWRRS